MFLKKKRFGNYYLLVKTLEYRKKKLRTYNFLRKRKFLLFVGTIVGTSVVGDGVGSSVGSSANKTKSRINPDSKSSKLKAFYQKKNNQYLPKTKRNNLSQN